MKLIEEAKIFLATEKVNEAELVLKRNEITHNLCWFLPTEDNFDLILKSIERSNSILDIGCGTGIVGKYITNKYPSKKYRGIRIKKYDCDYITHCNPAYITDLMIESKLTDFLNSNKYDSWLLIWPPYATPLAENVLTKFLEHPSVKKLIYIGELEGCNGDVDFQNHLDSILFDIPHDLNVETEVIDTYPSIRDFLVSITKVS